MPRAGSKSMSQWYPRKVGDVMRKTSHLSMGAMGAYDRLLDWYYAKSKALPIEWAQMYRICGAIVPDEQTLVRMVVEEFFVKEGDGWHNKTADEELEKRKEISGKRKAAQAEGQKSKATKQGTNVPTNEGTCVPTSTPTIEVSKDTSTPISPIEAEMFFCSVWEAYPGHGKYGARGAGYKGPRKKAFEIFTKLLKAKKDHDGFTKELIAGAYVYRDFLDRTGGPSKHLTTWLNGDCWSDDYSSTEGDGPRGGRPGGLGVNAQALAEGVRRTMRDDGPEGPLFGDDGIPPVSSDE